MNGGLAIKTGFFVLLCICICEGAIAQQIDTLRTTPPDSSQIISDTLGFAPPASQTQSFQSGATDSSLADTPDAVNFQSSDSLIFDLSGGNRKATLFGSAQVTHDTGELSAGKISLDLDKTTVEANTETPEDTLSLPVLKRQSEQIKSSRILFNYQTNKGKFETAQVQVQDGHLIGSKVKNINEQEVFIEDGIYSTCPPDHMTYYIKARKMKVVDQDEIFFSDARLYILDIPYPLIFPFGYIPAGIEDKQSGLLTPTYVFQQQSTRGLGLQNFGWFQYFNDFLTAQASVDIFTSGTFFLNSTINYRNRGRYDGSINLGFSSENSSLEPTDSDFTNTINRRVGITHNQDFSPYASLTADIDIRTSDFNRRNSFDIDERAEVSTTSRIGYNYRQPAGVFNFGTSLNFSQNFTDNSATLSGPSMNFSLRQFSPFRSNNPGSSSQQRFYENISVSYRNNFDSRFEYRPIDADSAEISFTEALFSPSKFREATGSERHYEFGFRQDASVTAGRLLPSQFLNLSASANITEFWYPTSTNRFFDEENNQVVEQQQRGFITAREFSTGINFSTTFYGISNLKIGKLNGFRHTMRPNIGFSYRPDFSDPKWGFFEEVQTDSLGNTRRFSKFSNEIFGGPGAGEQQSLSFGINNVFETRVVKRDSSGEVSQRTLKIIENLSLNSSYNFAADSLNLANLNMSANTRAVGGVSLRANANFSFYQRDSLGLRINEFLIEDGEKLMQMENFGLSASYTLPRGRGARIPPEPVYGDYNPYDQSIFDAIDPHYGNRAIHNTAFSGFSASFSFRYDWRFRFDQSPQRSATLNARNIQFQLTPRWNFSTRIGYDFIEKELTPSQFNLVRQLECWTLTFQMNPFGDFQYFFFKLSINSSQIQSIFQKLPVLNNLERTSSPTGRGFPGGF